ncbi:MAG: GntG family PLP-dependent aldolase [Bacteroidota bacterium]
MRVIDLRSDTVTRPSAPMRAAMAEAEVGDDVFGEDPSVNLLQERVAEILGKEAALFVPSGTMGNQICIKVHTRPGDEVIAERDSHVFNYETGGMAFLSGVQAHTVEGRGGMPAVARLQAALRPRVYYMPRSSLICLENTHNRAGGAVLPLPGIRDIRTWAASEGIPMHLDGARLWNASVASGVSPRAYAAFFDSVSVCLSKGLGAPAGSLLAGTAGFIAEARRYRKIFGGGMRQSGVLAAAGLYALEHNVERLAEDHDNARLFASELAGESALEVIPESVHTNIVLIGIERTGRTQEDLLRRFRDAGVLLTPGTAGNLRAVTHMDVTSQEVRRAALLIRRSLS